MRLRLRRWLLAIGLGVTATAGLCVRLTHEPESLQERLRTIAFQLPFEPIADPERPLWRQ